MSRPARWGLVVALAAAAAAGGCSGSAQPPDGAERIKLEQERRSAEELYADTLSQLRRFEQFDLDESLPRAQTRIDALSARLAELDRTLESLEKDRKRLIGQMDIAPTTQRDWAEQVEAVRLMRKQAELDRAGVQSDLVRARESMAELRQLSAQREILSRDALVQEKRLLELNRRLQ
jgi:hypothetical protein